MGRRVIGGGRWVVGVLAVLGLARTAAAVYLDEDQNISLRARIYSQASISTNSNNSQLGSTPAFTKGDVVQHRNFFNPELDAKLTSYLTWMRGGGLGWLAPDELSFRLAGWGFYDGIYDYGAGQYDVARRKVNRNFPNIDPTAANRTAFQMAGPGFFQGRVCSTSHVACAVSSDCPVRGEGCVQTRPLSIAEIFPDGEAQNPRDIYGTSRRVNELYLSYSKGPVFVRLGRQAISWGESDTIALLDANNPFDLTLGAPGVFEDIDEARIPLWTVRASLQLFDHMGPLSSGFVESYWVPGDIDQNTGILPLLTASPYSVPRDDPQTLIPALLNKQFVLLDRTPHQSFGNSRWGVRLQTVVARTHTLSAWYYLHYPSQPAPQSLGLTTTDQRGVQVFTTQTVHELTEVVGAADTFFLEPLDSILRLEGEFFMHEPGFNPAVNLNITPGASVIDILNTPGHILYSDHLRFEVGLDRFFFFRLLNPSNSFIFVSAIVGDWNMSEGGHINYKGQSIPRDYFMTGQTKQGASGQDPSDYVTQKKVEAFGQMHVQTDYMHGRLSPGVTFIQNVRGTYALLFTGTYRWTDWLLFTLNYTTIGGEYQQLGFFRDRDQVQLRATYQLN